MTKLELMPQEEFRAWFIAHFRVQDWQLTKMFEDFEYDGQNYIPKRPQGEETRRGKPSDGTATLVRKP